MSLIKVAATVAMFWTAVCVCLLSAPHTLDPLTLDTELTLDLEIEIEVADISDNVTSEGADEPPNEAANEGILLNFEPVLAELDGDGQETDLFETETITITPHLHQSNDSEITIIATTSSATGGNDNTISLDGNSFMANTSKNGSYNLTAEEYIPNNNNRSATGESKKSNSSATDMNSNISAKVNASQDKNEQASISNASVTNNNNSSNSNIISNIMSTATVNNPNATVNNSLDDDDIETRRGKYYNISLVQLVFFILLLVILG